MSKYSIYKSYASFLTGFYKRYRNKNVDCKKMLSLKGLALVDRFLAMDYAIETSTPMLFRMLYGEFVRESLGNPAIFLKDHDVSRLVKGKYQLNAIPSDLFPFDAFTVCFPISFEVNGRKLPGVQVSFINNRAQFQRNAQRMLSALPSNKFFANGEPVDVAYQDNELTLSYVDHGDEEHTFMTYRGDALLQIINSENAEEFKRNAQSLSEVGAESFTLTDSELERQYVILRAVLGLCVFLKAKPNALKEGFPAVRGFALAEPFGVPTRSMHFDAGHVVGSHASPDEHYRTWHIRQLSHPRFYQDEYRDMLPGSRLVFVSDTMVNSTASVKSLSDEAAPLSRPGNQNQSTLNCVDGG